MSGPVVKGQPRWHRDECEFGCHELTPVGNLLGEVKRLKLLDRE